LALALIVAAGRGERLGTDGPKALAELAGRPLLQWSVDLMLGLDGVERVVVALPPGVSVPAGTVGVEGGPSRSESVRRALAAAGPGDPVLVHDAARPLVTAELVRRTLAALADDASSRLDAAIAAVPVSDTIKRVQAGPGVSDPSREADPGRDADPGREAGVGPVSDHSAGIVVETLDRSALWAVQTPQVFRRAALERALDVPTEILAQATDDAWLVERLGGRVAVVPAGSENLKVTTPLDLALAELLLARRRA
jgi:2-C-methyl-D-erythritol 4-phosphate cytidylyltransferase